MADAAFTGLASVRLLLRRSSPSTWMVAGHQILSAILLATGQVAGRNSLAFLAGVALAITVGTMAAYWLFRLVEISAPAVRQGTVGTVIDWLVIALLLILMVRVYVRRKNTPSPKWMGRLQTADAGLSFRLGLLLFLVMPTDVITMVTVGASLARGGDPWWQSVPFLVLTLLLVGLPLTILLLLGKRAQVLLPGAARLDDYQLVGRQRGRDCVLPRPHHLQPRQLALRG